ncbi:BACON domain-containing protein [Bacteroides cellulosilyticus]|uniref:BACON domain-containing carbohydrate-binding protein n=1 Tax=Bacteroides cellulosilyticus TaxID=246787 RepID=A0AAW8VF35_9BACE|nr:BACON domain-containing carbohydrate-binding protein [Bacteroides cellulosilyticus]MDT4510564.1 BACON domain-containing carbohydrate-binding protein [Bacteroides cellulosilyticus]
MKNTWHLLACLMLLVACSDDKVEDETTITLPPKTETLFEKGVNFTTSAGTQSLEFTATENWNITAATTRNGEKWYQVYPTSGGPGKAEISISVEDNDSYDERSVAITINAGKTKKTLMVAQKQKNALLISSERREVKQEGGTIDVEVEANVEYKAVIADDCQSWIKPAASTTTRGLKASTISFKIEMNGEREKREGEIYITDGTLTETVKVYQYGGDVILLNENEYPVGDRGETIKVELRSNCEYGITMPDVSWIKEATMSRGMSSHTIYYTISPNDANESRRAKIIFYNKDNTAIADTLTVIQAQKDAVVIDNKNIELKTPNDTIMGIDVNANVDVEIHLADTCQWITESTAARGLQLRKIYLKAAKNDGFAPRRGRVLIKSKNGQECDTLKIWQAGKPTAVKLEQTSLDIPMAGGTYRIKVDANVPVKMTKWDLLWPEDKKEDPIYGMHEETIFKKALFMYENKPQIPYQATLSNDGQYLEIKVEPAVSAEASSATITIYGAHENKEAKLTIKQETDPTKVVRLCLTQYGEQEFVRFFEGFYLVLQQMYTQEELYSRQSEKEEGYEWRFDFINHTLNANNGEVRSAWSSFYNSVNMILFIKDQIPRSSEEELASSDSTTVMKLLDMQRFILFYEKVNLWGKAVCLSEFPSDIITSMPAISQAEVLKLFVEPLLFLRERLPGEISGQSAINDCFFPSRDFPALLLARIYMEQGKFAEAKSMLTGIVNSGRYQLGDLIYQFPVSDMYSDIQLICFSYTEVVLNLAECESRLGNSAQAENYLNQVITANIGSPAYSSNVSLSSSAFTTRTSDEFIKRLANVWQSELRGTGTYFAFLKRNNIAVSTLNIPVWRQVFPVPMREILVNPSMSQNEGY